MTPPASPPFKTKLFIPTLRNNLVARPRLVEGVNRGTQHTLTLISAPPGFGKTTLLAEWAAQSRMPLAWISLDEGDNDSARFLACLLAALEPLQTSAAPASGLADFNSLPPALVLDACLGDLVQASAPFVLVLDDFHLITAPNIHELLVLMLEHAPWQMRLVIATRGDPPIPLARLRSQGELNELRASELRFTEQEAAEFLRKVMGLSISADQIAALEARTEGWIAGLQLAALSMQGRDDLDGFIQAFSGSHRFILDYLVEEVIERQPESIRRFLLQTSILERICGPLCDTLLGTPGASQAILENLERSNLFLVPLDDERSWYRYHHLFGELLRARLELQQPGQAAGLHRLAAAWWEQNGFVIEAIQHSLAAGDYPQAAHLIQLHGHERWSFSDITFLALVGQLPQDLLVTQPTLGIYRAWTYILYGQLDLAQELLEGMARHLPLPGNLEEEGIHGFIELLFAYVGAHSGKDAEISLPARQVLDFIPVQFLAMRNSADVVFARLLAYQGRFDEAAEILLATSHRDLASGGTTAMPICIAFLARLRIIQGRLHEALALCRDYLGLLEQRGKRRFYVSGNLDLALAEVLLEWNDLPAAERQIQEGMRANQDWNIPNATVQGFLLLSQLRLAAGDYPGSDEALKRAQAAAAGRTLPPELAGDLAAFRIKLDLAFKKHPSSRAWAEHIPQTSSNPYRWEADLILLARLLIAEQDYAQALRLLEHLQEQASAGQRAGRLVKIHLLTALAHFALRNLPMAQAALTQCLDLAEPQGYRLAFLEEGQPARELLAACQPALKAVQSRYVKDLLDAFAVSQPELHPPGLVEPLTRRELEVLRCLAAGESNQEIAARLIVTISAVKKHTGNIYGKLGVSSRTQAIVRARELGLV